MTKEAVSVAYDPMTPNARRYPRVITLKEIDSMPRLQFNRESTRPYSFPASGTTLATFARAIATWSATTSPTTGSRWTSTRPTIASKVRFI